MAPSYRYTVNDGILTPSQRKFYEENGFIVFPKLIPDADLDACRQQFLDICDGKINTAMTVMKDKVLREKGQKGEFLVNKIQDVLYDDVLFDRYASHPEIIKVVRSIVGPNITAVHSMLINKPPDSTTEYSRHPLHQDLHYFPFRPSDRICASWTAMENVNKENGCLFVIPGSHKGDLYPHDYPNGEKNLVYHGVKGFDNIPKVHLIMEKGDTVFFNPLLLHGSGPNLTKGFRKVISVHYASNDCHFINVRGTTQEGIAKEIEEIAKRKGLQVDIVGVWQGKSRVVVGNPGAYQEMYSKL